MKTQTILSLCALLIPASPLVAQNSQLVPHGWSENTVKGDFTLKPESEAKHTFQIGVLLAADEKLIVKDVMKDSPAQKAGIQAGDELVEINGIKLSGINSLRGMLSAAGAQELEISVKRGEGGHVLAITPEPTKKVGERSTDEAADSEMPAIKPLSAAAEALEDNEQMVREFQSRIHRSMAGPQGNEKIERLLGEILAEMKKMNQRQAGVSRGPRLQRTDRRPGSPPQAEGQRAKAHQSERASAARETKPAPQEKPAPEAHDQKTE